MSWGWGLRPRALLFLLALATRPGDGNEGSVTGSCLCNRRISSSSRPVVDVMEHLRKYVKAYNRCPNYIRFQLPSRSVCGGSQYPWVLELMSCFDRRECGHAYRENLVHQKHLSSTSTMIPRPTEGTPPDRHTLAQKYPPPALQPTQKPTLLPGALSLDKELTYLNETTTPTVGYSLGAGHEAEEKQKQLDEKASATGGTSAVTPVLSLLVIVFFLTGVSLYMWCKRKKEQPLQYSPDLQFYQHLPATPDSNA